MSFPRNTDVSRHLARKRRLALPVKPTSAAESAKAALKSLTEDLAAAVNSAQNSSKLGRSR